jgi:hypothetical protein
MRIFNLRKNSNHYKSTKSDKLIMSTYSPEFVPVLRQFRGFDQGKEISAILLTTATVFAKKEEPPNGNQSIGRIPFSGSSPLRSFARRLRFGLQPADGTDCALPPAYE